MHFATVLSFATIASTVLALPTSQWTGEGYGGKTKTPPQYNTSTAVQGSPSQPTSYTSGKNEASSYKPSKGQNSPGQYNGGNGNNRNCLTDEQADQGAEIFRQMIQNYTDTLALTVLTPDFEDYTSSVNIIRNRGNKGPIQVNGISFTSREDFMNAQGAQPQIPFTTLNVFHGCDSITVRWETTDSAAGQATKVNDIVSLNPRTQRVPFLITSQPAPGIAILHTIPATDNEYGFRIETLYSEFNAAAWLVNLGVFTPAPPAANKRDLPHIVAI